LRKEGCLRRYFFKEGFWVDAELYAMTAEEFGIKRPKPQFRTSVVENL